MRKFFKKHWKKIAVVAALIAGALIIYFFVLNPLKATAEIFVVKRGTLKEELTVSGEIEAEEKVDLTFQTPGRLVWVGVKKGDRIQKFQGIAALDQRELQKLLQKSLNNYLANRQDFDQAKDDTRDKVITDAIKRTLVKSQASLDNTVLDVELQDLAKQFSNLATPIEGVVTRVDSPFAGVNIVPAQAVFEVVNPKSIYFSATADQTEVPLLKEGQSGTLVLDAFPDKTFKGTINEISFTPEVDESGTVYRLKFPLKTDNSDYQFKLGMTGDLTFITSERKNVVYVPTVFIKTEGDKKQVILIKNGKKEKVFVKTGLETDENTEITSNLKAGDKIVSE